MTPANGHNGHNGLNGHHHDAGGHANQANQLARASEPNPAEVVSRADMHVHSSASAEAKLAISRGIGLPECATKPDEVYELAKARGMDFVTITDHDTIDGCLELAAHDDFFISEELTAWFRDEPQAVHILCYGITPDDHAALQERAGDLEACAEYLSANEILAALAHPFFAVAAPLESRHRRRLAELFEIWEVRNGSRAARLNAPALTYVDSHGGIGIGGSDDHGGLDIGRTFTETPAAADPAAFLAQIRAGHAVARGAQGSAAKWAHSALALAARTLPEPNRAGERDATPGRATAPVDAAALLALAEGVVSDGVARGGSGDGRDTVAPAEAATLLDAWADSVHMPRDRQALIAELRSDELTHAAIERRARRAHERLLGQAAAVVGGVLDSREDWPTATQALLEACLPVVPYVPAAAILGREQARIDQRHGNDDADAEPRRIALIADGIDEVHGLSHVIQRIREQGVPGYTVEIVGVDPCVDRRLPAVAAIETSLYPGTALGVPAIPELVDVLCEGRYDAIHVATPGPVGVFATLAARIAGLPLVCSHHTEFVSYAVARSPDAGIETAARLVLGAFYRQARAVLSPSPSADRSLASIGVEPELIWRWARGVDHELYELAGDGRHPVPGRSDRIRVLYAGRLTPEKGVDLLADSFIEAHERDPRLHLVVAGGGPEEDALRERLGRRATFLGWLGREQLARAYSDADIFLFCSETDTYGQVITEAQASRLPVVAVDRGGPSGLIRDRQTGWLCPPEPHAIAAAVAQLASSPFMREQIGARAAQAVAGRTWAASFAELAGAYDRVLAAAAHHAAATPVALAA